MAINEQDKIIVPFANSGLRNDIPETATGSNLASMQEGFPAVTMTDIASGGQPPDGKDFNGILNVITKILQYAQSGGLYKYDSDYAESVNGYPVGAILRSADGSKIWMNTTANNSSDPDNGGQNWAELTNTNALATALAGYLPLTGGTVNGTVHVKNGDATSSLYVSAKNLYVSSTDVADGSYLRLSAQDATSAGGFSLNARNGDSNIALKGDATGGLTWNDNTVLTTASTLDASKLNVSCLPTAGGTMTGNISVNTSDFQIYHVPSDGNSGRSIIRGGDYNFNSGASAYFHGVNHGTRAGFFDIYAHNGTASMALSGTPSGSLTWNGNEVLTTANGLSLSGGTMTGSISFTGTTVAINKTTADSYLYIRGGTDNNNGASLMLAGQDDSDNGLFRLRAGANGSNIILEGTVSKNLKWDGKEIERINASGDDYIRYENGLQFCWGAVDINNSTQTTITYPVEFLAGSGTDYKYGISCAVNNRANFYLTPNVNGKTAVAMTSNASGQRMWWTAMGRWK